MSGNHRLNGATVPGTVSRPTRQCRAGCRAGPHSPGPITGPAGIGVQPTRSRAEVVHCGTIRVAAMSLASTNAQHNPYSVMAGHRPRPGWQSHESSWVRRAGCRWARLADHDRRRLGVAADERGHNRGDDHAQPIRAAHGQLLVDHGGAVPSPIKDLPDEVVVGLGGDPLTNAAVGRVMMASDNCLWRFLAICGVPPDRYVDLGMPGDRSPGPRPVAVDVPSPVTALLRRAQRTDVLGHLARACSLWSPGSWITCMSGLSGPVRDRPCSLPGRTSSAADCCSADSSAGFLFAARFQSRTHQGWSDT